MPTMPNLVGLELSAAQAALQATGVLNLSSIGYFGNWPITVQWVSEALASLWTADTSLITADSDITVDTSMALFPGQVLSQSIQAGNAVSMNAPISLSVIEYPVSVAYP